MSAKVSTLVAMTTAATALLTCLDDQQRASACHSFDTQVRRRWTYLPRPRPGVCLADLDRTQRKACSRLLATALSPHAYAQAVTIMALEEVLDREEGWRRGRHANDFWVALFGTPGSPAWGWRYEGHHLSVTMTIVDGQISPTPCFFGANPASVTYGDTPVLRPLGLEEDLARAALAAMTPGERRAAVVAPVAPSDIRSGPTPQVAGRFEPVGVAAGQLPKAAESLLHELIGVYLHRLPPDLAAAELARLDPAELHFAWEGPLEPGCGHYYRIQAPSLLIEYDNTSNNANHVHAVWRRPGEDFGESLLAQHYLAEHDSSR
ncbi:MAG: DUF3500 domain-containing protein [Pseudonocardiaceae bacterium]